MGSQVIEPAGRSTVALEPIGLIGLGRMGMPMAQHLRDAGCQVLAYRRRDTPNARQWLGEGGAVADDFASLSGCRSVILSLPTTDDVRGVAARLLAVLRPGTLVLDTSTIHPSGAREFAALAQQHELAWLDAPVSGGPAGAQAGTLAVMVGGSRSDFDRARPLLNVMGRTVAYFGGSGSGLVCKLINNTLLALSALATCEALALVAKAGLDRPTALQVISAGSGYNRFMDTRGKVLVQRGAFEPAAFTVNMLLKDLRVASDACSEIGFTPSVLHTALVAFERTVAIGLGEEDFSSVLRVVEADAGVRVA